MKLLASVTSSQGCSEKEERLRRFVEASDSDVEKLVNRERNTERTTGVHEEIVRELDIYLS